MFRRSMLSLLFCLSAAVTANAFEAPISLSFSGGWRYDCIKTVIIAEDPKDFPYLNNTLKGEDLMIWEAGLQGRLPFSECFCDSDCWWLNVFYLKGYAYWGRVYDGHYHETSTTFANGETSSSKGKADKGSVYDYNIALGWLYPVNDCSAIAPMVGYAWDQVKFKTGKVRSNGEPDDVLNGLNYTSRFIGPWAGLEAFYGSDNWRLNLGYEYHWTHWKGVYNLHGPDEFEGAYSDRRKANNGQGNVVYVNGSWFCPDGWEINLGFKFRDFRATNGSERPQAPGGFPAVQLPATEFDRVHRSTWQSYEVTFDLVYTF